MNTTDLRTMDFAAPASLASYRMRSLIVGGVAALIALITAFIAPHQFYRGYLIGYMWTLGIALGSLALLMLGHLTGGQWWLMSRRIFEAATRTLPVWAVMFIPIAIGMFTGKLYIWTDQALVASDKVLQDKHPWLNPTAWVLRAVFWLLIWNALAFILNKWSDEQDRDADPNIWRKLKAVAAPGIVIWALTITFAAVDWVMSLDPHWFSSIYGMLFMIGQALSALAFTILVLAMLSKYQLFSELVTATRLHDLGKLLLAFTMVWAYFSFSQFLIIWMANLPEEISWYLDRTKGAWGAVALMLIFGQFVLPFALLLSRDLKRDTRRLAPVAILVIVMRWVDIYWLTVPNPDPMVRHVAGETHFSLHFAHIAAPVALMGIWLAVFFWNLAQRPLLVRNEPMLPKLWERSHGH